MSCGQVAFLLPVHAYMLGEIPYSVFYVHVGSYCRRGFFFSSSSSGRVASAAAKGQPAYEHLHM